MEQTSANSEPAKSNATIYIIIVVIIIALAGIGYYVFGARTQSVMPNPSTGGGNANDPMKQKIPGVTPNNPNAALGVLTDPGFFNGLNSLANNFFNMAKDIKANKEKNASSASNSNSNTVVYDGPVTQQQAQAGASWGGLPYSV